MLVIGLTGGIGSGKSAATAHFENLGITVVDADIASRTVVEPGKPALAAIEEHFGSDVINEDGSLNRAALRVKVFEDAEERRWLEQLTHPLIREEIEQGLKNATSPYAILASPLLVEAGQHKLTQRVLVIDVPEELQLARTMSRDNNSEAQVKAIMAAQTSRQARRGFADDIIVNDGTLEQLQVEVEKLHQQYLTLAQSASQ